MKTSHIFFVVTSIVLMVWIHSLNGGTRTQKPPDVESKDYYHYPVID